MVKLPCNDGVIVLRTGCGALMGDQYAVRGFLSSFERPSNMWNAMHVFHQPVQDFRRFFSCWSPSSNVVMADKTDQSFSKYAGDIVEMILAPNGSGLKQIFEASLKSMEILDDELQEDGYAQNRDKLLAVIALNGPGSRLMTRELAKGEVRPPFKCVQTA